MNDIFLSYASPDRAVAKKFADVLESFGWSVWWDREIPLGTNFDRVIEEELKAARCVVVLWSKESVQSTWVRSEASSAVARHCLIPVLIDDAAIPLEFTLIQAAELTNWDGNTTHPEFNRLVQAVRQMLGEPAPSRVELNEKNKHFAAVSPAVWWRTTRGFSIAAAVFVILLALTFGRNALHRVPSETLPQPEDATSATTSAVSEHPVNAPAPDPAGQGRGQTGPPAGAFPIKIGDKIGEGIPGPGAGGIEKPHGQDVYAFTATPGQRVYFRMLRHSAGMEQVRWRLVDGDGTEVFNTCLGCTEPGMQTLTKGGTYILTLGSNDNASTGTYELRLFNIPPPNHFAIKVGDRIADQVPGPGAGIIETPGAEDIYTFTAAPRQKVYFRILEYSTGMEQIHLRLVDDDSMEIFDRCLGCSEPGVQTLITGGTYTLIVGNKTNPATGSYRLQLFNVPPPQQFSLKIGDRIRAGVPGPGAGIIETPGAEDVYSFTAAPGQRVYVRLLQHDPGMDQNKWRMMDDNGMEIFNMCLGCSQPGPQTLTKGGPYTIVVGSSTNPSTGSYAFEIGAN